MSQPSTAPAPPWHRATHALVAGLGVASGLFFLIAAIQTPGLDPPPESAALFLVVASAATISYVLLPARGPAGYLSSMLTAVGVWVLLGVVVSGMYGAGGPRTNPAGPIWYALLAAGVFVAAGLAWRTGDGSARESRSSRGG